MIRLASALAVAALLSLTGVGTASADNIYDAINTQGIIQAVLAGKGGGPAGGVGDPFLPHQVQVDPREACLAKGGTPKNQIESDGSIGIRCIVAR